MNATDELSPYFLVRVRNGRADFARWRSAEGHDALALFLSEEVAQRYSAADVQETEWRIVRPQRLTVLEILRGCHDLGIRFAVLDPDGERAKRVFSIGEVLQAVAME